jgi:PKD repeat protein
MPDNIQDGLFDNTGAVANPPYPPVADIAANETGFTNMSVDFSGAGSYDPDGTAIVSYDWTFGDGTTSTDMAPSHTYTVAGVYNVGLRVTDELSQVSAKATHTIVVNDWSPFPVAIIVADEIGFTGEPMSFSGAESYDPDGNAIISYLWFFGDGTTSTDMAPSHTYTVAGIYNVGLVVTDEQGEWSEKTIHTIDVEVRLPFNADLVDRKAWPERHRHSLSKHDDINVLTARFVNKGIDPVKLKVVFTIYDGRRGKMLGELETDEITLELIDTPHELTVDFDATDWGTPKYVAYIKVQCWFGKTTPDTPGHTLKHIKLAVVP